MTALDMQTTLAGVSQLNRPGQRWGYWVQGNTITARYLWQDQSLFGPGSVTHEVQEFSFIVELQPDGTYKEHTHQVEETAGVQATPGGVGLSWGKSSSSGQSRQKSFSMSFGHDNQTGQTGVVTAGLNTDEVKQPLVQYLAQCGWTPKHPLMSKMFGG